MKLFLVPFLLVAAESVPRNPLRRGDSMYVYMFDDTNSDNRELESGDSQPIGYREYELDRVLEVEGRQGVATNGTHYFVSGSTALYVYSLEGKLLKSNEDPFVGLEKPANHFGDISHHNGEIYTGAEWFEDGRGQDIQIAVYDAETLNFTRAFPWDPLSGQVEVSGLAVDAASELVWMTDWVNGNYIYRYNLSDGEYSGKLHLRPLPQWSQGIASYKGALYITADDGNADRKEFDNLWRVPTDALNNSAAYIRHELVFDEFMFRDFGEIEGIDFNEATADMMILANRGRQIVLGTPMDFYPGYDREIHEVYVFRIIEVDPSNETDAVGTLGTPSAAPLAWAGHSVFVAIIASIGAATCMILN